MNFFDEPELEGFYNKPFDEISPTDTPVSKYICGDKTITCHSCGATLQVYCRGHKSGHASGFTEIAYCDDCELQHRRTRSPVSDDVDYQYGQYRVDEREEYVCSDCHERHPITIPDGDFETREHPEIHSYEQVTIPCPCGMTVSIDTVSFPEEVSCSKCSRTYSFGVSVE